MAQFASFGNGGFVLHIRKGKIMAKTVRMFTATMGGMAYRVSVSKDTAYYSTKSYHANTWKVKAKEHIDTFLTWAESKDLFSPYYGDNPALVHYRIQYLLHGYTV